MQKHYHKKYTLTDNDVRRLQEWHYHAPRPETQQAERYQEINHATRDVAELLMNYCPPGRQLALALTKLEECKMWANNAIAME